MAFRVTVRDVKHSNDVVTCAEPALPLSAAQHGFWFQEMFAGDGGASATLSFGLDTKKTLDAERLAQALGEVAGRHPLLRGRFTVSRGAVTLSIDDRPSVRLDRLSENGTLERWLQQPISVRDWPLWRAGVVSGELGSRLRVLASHTIFDGESKDIFLRHLLAAYRRPDALLREPTCAGTMRWRAYVAGEAAAGTFNMLPSVRTPEPPRAHTPAQGAWREHERFSVEARLLSVIRDAARRLGVSQFTIHLTAWHAVLARLQMMEEDVVTPIALSTRGEGDQDEIGPFVNQLPVRSSASGQRTFRAVALELGDAVRHLAAHRQQPPPSACLPSLVSVSYRRAALGCDWPYVDVTPVLLPAFQVPTAAAVVRLVHHGSWIDGAIDVDRSRLPDGYATTLSRAWQSLMRAGALGLDRRIADLPIEEVA